MRNEEQMLQKIIEFANNDDSIRVVMMNGSRVNSNALKDIMQDYDIVYFVEDLENKSFIVDRSWIKYFGDLVIMQHNDFDNGSYIIMMQFKDGVRIDLGFRDIKKVNEEIKKDSLSKILLDKDNITDKLPEPDDSTYFVKKPSEKEWNSTLNELWWIQSYVAKGIWRDELPLAKYMYDVIFMDCIRKLLSWHIGIEYNWQINVGKCGKWFKQLLDKDIYNRFAALYTGTDYDDIWQKLFWAGAFIRQIGEKLATELNFTYPMQDDINVSEFIRRIQSLPKDATSL